MTLPSAFFSPLYSTTVRFIKLLFLFNLLRFNGIAHAEGDVSWRRDSVREQQVAERIYQWQKRGRFTMQYCWQSLRIDDTLKHSQPVQHRLAAEAGLSDQQLRADYIRQQLYCLLEQQTAFRAAAVESLRRRLPNLRVDTTSPNNTLTTTYSELLAAQLTLVWLRANGERTTADRALQFWQSGHVGVNYLALAKRPRDSQLIAQQLQQRLWPNPPQWANFSAQ